MHHLEIEISLAHKKDLIKSKLTKQKKMTKTLTKNPAKYVLQRRKENKNLIEVHYAPFRINCPIS